MIKRILTVCLCVLLSGCGYKNSTVTKITFSTWGSASEIKILEPIIKDFEDKNPDIKIELRHIPQNYFEKIHLLFASNLEPDVIFINNINLPVYSSRLADLTGIVNEKDFYKQGIEGLSVSGKLYAVPRDISVLMVYYNKDLFDKFGVSYPNKSWSLKDLEEKAHKLTSNKTWGISYEPNIYYAYPYIRNLGSEILNSDCVQETEKKNFKAAIKYYKNMAYLYHIAPMTSQIGSKTAAQMFLEGQLGMYVSGRWLVPKFRECALFDWEVVNFPNCSAPIDASGWAISKSSKHKDIALRFVLFLSSKENISKMTKDGLIIPARKDVAESNIFLSGKPSHSELFLYSVKNSKITNVNSKYNKLVDRLNDKDFKD